MRQTQLRFESLNRNLPYSEFENDSFIAANQQARESTVIVE